MEIPADGLGYDKHYLKCVVPKNIHTPPTKGTFVLDPHPPGISIPGGACHPSIPWNFRSFQTWLGTPWKEYFGQKCRGTIVLWEWSLR